MVTKELILDTETTGLGEDDEIIEICLIDLDGNILLNTLIKPTIPISKCASKIHGIYDSDVQKSPSWKDIHQKFLDIIKNNKINIYNAHFDIQMINQTCYTHGFGEPSLILHCVMEKYAKVWGDWHYYFKSYKWQSLSDAAEQQNIDISDLTTHRAVADCEITRRLLLKIKNNQCMADPMQIEIRKIKSEEKRVEQELEKQREIRSEYNYQYAEKIRKLKYAMVPENVDDYDYFGRDNRPNGYKTLSQLKVNELHLFEYAGTCCSSYGDRGYIFKPK